MDNHKRDGVRGVCVLCWTLALCATGCAAFVPRRYRQLFRCASPPDLSLLHFTLLHQRHRRGACGGLVCENTHRTLAPAGTKTPRTPSLWRGSQTFVIQSYRSFDTFMTFAPTLRFSHSPGYRYILTGFGKSQDFRTSGGI